MSKTKQKVYPPLQEKKRFSKQNKKVRQDPPGNHGRKVEEGCDLIVTDDGDGDLPPYFLAFLDSAAH